MRVQYFRKSAISYLKASTPISQFTCCVRKSIELKCLVYYLSNILIISNKSTLKI